MSKVTMKPKYTHASAHVVHIGLARFGVQIIASKNCISMIKDLSINFENETFNLNSGFVQTL